MKEYSLAELDAIPMLADIKDNDRTKPRLCVTSKGYNMNNKKELAVIQAFKRKVADFPYSIKLILLWVILIITPLYVSFQLELRQSPIDDFINTMALIVVWIIEIYIGLIVFTPIKKDEK